MRVIKAIQVLLILIWTAISAIIGAVLLLITWNRIWVNFVSARYIWTPFLVFLCGARVRSHNIQTLNPKKPAIYVSNHTSLFDIVAIARVLPVGPFFIAKKELKKVPFLGWYMTMIGMIFIDRGNSEAAMKSMKFAAGEIQKGKNIITFPEGTRSKNGKLGVFRRGTFIIAREGDIDIVPIGLKGADLVLPNGSFMPRNGTVHVNFGSAIHMRDHRDKSLEELSSFVRDEVLSLIAEIK